MEIIIQPTAEAASVIAARMVARLLREKPDAVLGLATGSTPLLLYRELVEMKLDWSRVTTFNLDEYVGLAPGPPGQSITVSCGRTCFGLVNIAESNVHIPDGLVNDIPVLSASVTNNRSTPSGGIDWQVAGDRHRRSHRVQRTDIVAGLAHAHQDADAADARRQRTVLWGGETAVPHHVITMGIGTIMEARQVVLLAFGPDKARAVAEAVEGPVTAMNPASILQLHPVAKIVLDEPAATLLRKADYYRWVCDNKPDWQKL